MQQDGQKWQQEVTHNDQLEQQKWQLIDSPKAFADGKNIAADLMISTWFQNCCIYPTWKPKPSSDINLWPEKTLPFSALPHSVGLE